MAGSSHVLESPPSTSTPILDRIIPLPRLPKRSWKSELWRALLGAAVMSFLAFVFLPMFRHGHLAMPPVLIFVRAVAYEVASIAANLFLAIIIHETGHMIAGLCSGYRLDFLRFGPIQINPPFRVSRAPKFGVYLPGMASLFPRRKDGVHTRAIV